MPATPQPMATRDLDRALDGVDQDLLTLVSDPPEELEALALLASWSPAAALCGTPTGDHDLGWCMGLANTPYKTHQTAFTAARNRMEALRWLSIAVDHSRGFGEPLLDRDLVEELHYIAQAGLLPDAARGQVRSLPATWLEVFRRRGLTLSAPRQRLEEELEDWIDRVEQDRRAGTHPVLCAGRAQIGLLRLRPFLRGNGQLARLIAEGILRKSGYPPLPLEALWTAQRDRLEEPLHDAVSKDDETRWLTWYARMVARSAIVAQEEAPSLTRIRRHLTAVLSALRDPDEISKDQVSKLATILCRCPVVTVQNLARAAEVSRPLAVRDLGARARVHGHLAPVDLGDTLPVVGLAAPDVLDLAHRLVSRSRRLTWR